MNNINYVLKFNEGILFNNETSKSKIILKKIILIIIAIIIIGSFIFRENIFNELSWTAKISLIMITISIFKVTKSGTHREPSPIEIRFYDDYLIVYREKRYYSAKCSRKEFNKFYYKDITKCQYRTSSRRINFYGVMEGTWYDYNKDGSLPEEPTYHRMINNGLCYFYTTEEPDIDFVSEIERHTPIKVVFEDC